MFSACSVFAEYLRGIADILPMRLCAYVFAYGG